VETASDQVDPGRDDSLELPPFVDLELRAPAPVADAVPIAVDRIQTAPVRGRRLSVLARRELLWITVIYLSARGLLLLAAYLLGYYGHHNFLGELSNWDGLWYRRLANHGYPAHVDYGQTTLGFFPLYPLTIWLLEPVFTVLTSHNQIWASTVAGLLISCVGGWVATVLVHRLADGWWGRAVARRATVLFIVFPGSVVFSMVYSEALLLPLAAGCIYALERRRWLLAGVLAGVGSAVQPVGLVLPVMCLASAVWFAHASGWSLSAIKRCAIAPLLSITGAVCFMVFLWIWTGNPFANYIAQHHGWSEKTDPLAMVHTATRMAPAFDPSHFNHPTINLNLVVGLIGGVVLLLELVLIWYYRREISFEAIVWTLGISFFALTSEFVPPNPRLLITAFPALMVLGRYLQGKWFAILVSANTVLLVVLSLLTFVGHSLRP
jgi:hypothetical protein